MIMPSFSALFAWTTIQLIQFLHFLSNYCPFLNSKCIHQFFDCFVFLFLSKNNQYNVNKKCHNIFSNINMCDIFITVSYFIKPRNNVFQLLNQINITPSLHALLSTIEWRNLNPFQSVKKLYCYLFFSFTRISFC